MIFTDMETFTVASKQNLFQKEELHQYRYVFTFSSAMKAVDFLLLHPLF